MVQTLRDRRMCRQLLHPRWLGLNTQPCGSLKPGNVVFWHHLAATNFPRIWPADCDVRFRQFGIDRNATGISRGRNSRMHTYSGKIGLGLCFLGLQILLNARAVGVQTMEATIRVPYKNGSYVGKPLAWDGREMMLLRRDGKSVSSLPCLSSHP